MKGKTTAIMLILSALFADSAAAQTSSQILGFAGLMKPSVAPVEYPMKIDASNELRLLLTGSFVLYKSFISPQDASTCTFYPTCSVYALNTIRLNGFLGWLDAIDRLTRCNGLSPEKYTIHQPSKHLYDPVRKISDLH